MELVSVPVPRHQQPGLQGPQPRDTRGCALPDTLSPSCSHGPTAVHGWAPQPRQWCLHEHTLKGRKGRRERRREQKEWETAQETPRRERRKRSETRKREESSLRWSSYSCFSSQNRQIFLRELQPVEMT